MRTRMAGAIVLAVVVTLLAGCGFGQKAAQNPFSALVDAVTDDDWMPADDDWVPVDHDHDYGDWCRDPLPVSGDSGFESGGYPGEEGDHDDSDLCANHGSGVGRPSEGGGSGGGSGGAYGVAYSEGVPDGYVLPVYPDWKPEQFMEFENEGQIGWSGSFVLTGDLKTVAEKYIKELKAMGLEVSTMSSGSGEEYVNIVNIEGEFDGRVFRGFLMFGYYATGPMLYVDFAEPYAMYSEGHG